jgi:hypothetical protein
MILELEIVLYVFLQFVPLNCLSLFALVVWMI